MFSYTTTFLPCINPTPPAPAPPPTPFSSRFHIQASSYFSPTTGGRRVKVTTGGSQSSPGFHPEQQHQEDEEEEEGQCTAWASSPAGLLPYPSYRAISFTQVIGWDSIGGPPCLCPIFNVEIALDFSISPASFTLLTGAFLGSSSREASHCGNQRRNYLKWAKNSFKFVKGYLENYSPYCNSPYPWWPVTPPG